ncbi:MAG: response regulator [Chloroflexi bacterium]|nr:response regulator [Chloroflexota bacterium]
MRNVVVISNDESFLARATDLIKREGFGFHSFNSFPSSLRQVASLDPAVIVLDDQIGDPGVWECCTQLRREWPAPILITGPNANSSSMVKAINKGADFYLKRPFHETEFIARIKALLRRYEFSQQVVSSK